MFSGGVVVVAIAYQQSQSFGGVGLQTFANNFFGLPPSSPVRGKVELARLSMLDDECLMEVAAVAAAQSGKGGFFEEAGKGAGQLDLRGRRWAGTDRRWGRRHYFLALLSHMTCKQRHIHRQLSDLWPP